MVRKSKSKYGPTEIVISTDGISGTDESGVPITLPSGARVRGDHFLVRLLPEKFVPDGTPRDAWPSPYTESVEMLAAQDEERRADEAEAAAARPSTIDPATPIGAFMMCTNTVTSSAAGPCGKGAIVFADDARVALAPAAFRPLHIALALG